MFLDFFFSLNLINLFFLQCLFSLTSNSLIHCSTFVLQCIVPVGEKTQDRHPIRPCPAIRAKAQLSLDS